MADFATPHTSLLLKIPLLLICSACIHVTMTPPNPHAKRDSEERARYARDHAVREVMPMSFGAGQFAFKTTGHIICALEIVAISLSALSTETLQRPYLRWVAEHYIYAQQHNLYISPIFLLGFSLTVLGAYIRYSCYNHLGRHFTFELTIQPRHQLITSGPYALVRHPSYTGMFIFSLGSLVCMFGPGSFWRAAEMWRSPIGWLLGGFYIGYRVYVNVVLFARVAKEDEVLKREFGVEWGRWAKQTPYRLIPLVY